jgi:hypothetical protein
VSVLAETAYILCEPGVLVFVVNGKSGFLEGAHYQLPFFFVHFEHGHVAVCAISGHFDCLTSLALVNHEVSFIIEILQQFQQLPLLIDYVCIYYYDVQRVYAFFLLFLEEAFVHTIKAKSVVGLHISHHYGCVIVII